MALLFTPPAAAEESTSAPPAQPGLVGGRALLDFACDAHVACRIATRLVSRFIDEGRAELQRFADRYAAVADATRAPEVPEAEAFRAKFERYVKFQDFNRRLAAERAAREAQEFDAQVALVLRELAFTKRLAEKRATASGRFEDVPSDSQRENLYQRK